MRTCLRRSQFHPAHHTQNERRLRRQFQQPSGFLQGLPRLHRNTALKSLAFQFMPQICRKKIPSQRPHRLINPSVFPRVIDPEVLVSVDVHYCGPGGLLCCFLDDATFSDESAEMLIQQPREYTLNWPSVIRCLASTVLVSDGLHSAFCSFSASHQYSRSLAP